MFLFLSKTLPVLIYPLGVTLILLGLSVFKPRAYRKFVLTALAILWAFSTGIVSQALVASLENQYPALIAPTPASAIVVLGGYLRSPGGQHPKAEFSESSDRLIKALRLYRAKQAPVILLTGGNIAFYGAVHQSEAQAARDLLLEFGLPASALLMEDQSLNTYENALFSKQILQPKAISQILLVTSAIHMPRSVAIFQKLGFTVIAAPTDYLTGWGSGEFFFQLLPSPEGLMLSTQALKEWLGLGVYRIKGWA